MERPIRVLLVEDNPADVELIREAMDKNHITVELSVAMSGPEALSTLGRSAAGKAPLPHLVILDLNIPGVQGKDVLLEIRADDRLRPIPVIILTTSSARSDIIDSYRRGANSYVTKPLDLSEFEDTVRSLKTFWFNTARLPTMNGGSFMQ